MNPKEQENMQSHGSGPGQERTQASSQLPVLAGDLHHPDASLSAPACSCTAALSAQPLPTQCQAAEDALMLLTSKVSITQGGSHT